MVVPELEAVAVAVPPVVEPIPVPVVKPPVEALLSEAAVVLAPALVVEGTVELPAEVEPDEEEDATPDVGPAGDDPVDPEDAAIDIPDELSPASGLSPVAWKQPPPRSTIKPVKTSTAANLGRHRFMLLMNAESAPAQPRRFSCASILRVTLIVTAKHPAA